MGEEPCEKGLWFQPPALKPVQPPQGCWDIGLWVGTGWDTEGCTGGVTQAAFLRELTVSLERKDIHVWACSGTAYSHPQSINDVKISKHSPELADSSATVT